VTNLERSAPATVDEPAARSWSDAEESSLRLWIALARCYSSFAKAVSAKVQEYGLTTPQFGVLEALYHLGPLSLGELADKLLVTGGNVTYVMDRLEDQGLVCRERSPDDRRVIRAKLTEEGRDRIADVFQGHADFVHGLTRHLTPQEREDARSLLKKLGRGVMDSDL
jgi:MarR family transcriptional regulator, 2-MHQ and catechol-resistance regulon repressor